VFTFSQVGDALEVRHQHEVIRVEPWGTDSVRVRAARGSLPATDVGALHDRPDSAVAASISIVGQTATLTNGDLTVEITNAELEWPTPPRLRFLRTSTGQELLAEQQEHFWWPGARVYYGNRAASGNLARGYFVAPTVFDACRDDMAIVREEIFGPVLVAQRFDDLEEIAAMANDSPYGLGASIWGRDISAIHRLIPKLRAGTVWVNCHNFVDPAMPFGGYKQSGFGREHSHTVFEHYTEIKSVCIAL